MKKLLTCVVTFVVLVSSSLPIIAQKTRLQTKTPPIADSGSSRIGSTEAFFDGTGVLVRWTMDSERDNVGFDVVRISSGAEERITKNIIVGGFRSSRTDTVYGEKYSFFDERGSFDAVYAIETISSTGRRLRSETIAPKYVLDMRTAGENAQATTRSNTRKNRGLERSNLDLPTDLQNEVDENERTPDPAAHRAMVAQGGVKLGVKVDGFYRVTKTELQTNGFDVNSDPANWKLFTDGNEQSINVAANGDYVEFFGRGKETNESDARYYFLVAGSSAGKRIGTRSLRSFGSTTSTTNYRQSYSKKERVNYISSILNGSTENFWGNVVTTPQSEFTFQLSGVDTTAATATVEVKLFGFTNVTHTTSLAINGHVLASPATGSGLLPYSLVSEVPVSFLNEGTNTLGMTSSGGGDFSLFDSIHIDYTRKYVADQNQFAAYTTNLRGAKLTGFMTANVRVFDTTYDGDPSLLVGFPVLQNGPTFEVNLPAARGRVIYAVEDSAVKPVASIRQNHASTLGTTGRAGKLVIITHRNFMTEANAWAAYRTAPGFPVEVVDVEDVFDEFNYGQPTSSSVNAFLNYAKNNWATPPEYVLILGDASFDPKNYLGLGNTNLVPSKLVDTLYEETGSDEALADFDSDGLAEMAVGRIPALTPLVVSQSLAKVQAFEVPAMQDLNRGAVFAFDLPIGFDFEAMSIALRNELPPGIPVSMVGRSAPGSQAALIGAINNGRYIVNYSGHGATGTWAHQSFFTVNEVPLLSNANDRSIFTMLTCLNGYFINPLSESLAEKLLTAQNGGAVVSWASTGKTTPDIQLIMGTRFYNQINAGTITRMGDLIRDAKAAIPGGSDVRLSWALLGDPLLKVR